ncbi:sine oculis-binding protein homolog isoform X2 [Stigmatopora nigra]
MPEMEKGRPPESKRSRKPAHPVKREINQEMKTFAESTMNELLGWYGYDKVDLRDTEANEIRNYRERRQHVSVLKENSLPKPKTHDSKVSHSVLAMKSGDRESFNVPSSSSTLTSTSSSTTKEHKSAPVIVPLIKPSAVDDIQNVQIVCVWCQKEGVKHYSLCMGSELKSFCSEKCFAACRRAYFKRNKARDEDLHGERSPQHPHPEDTPRLVMKINSNSLSPVLQVCDWCKHVRHTKEYLDFGSGEERLQFCSTKCLNQYKMDVFYREARAALTCPSPARAGQEGRSDHNLVGQNLLTPESWNNGSNTGEALQRDTSPKGPTGIPGSSESSSMSSSESSTSSKHPVTGQRTLDRPIHPLPHPPAVEVSPHPTLIPPPPLPRHHLEHSPISQLRMPFVRPPIHAQGLRSPLANAHHPRPSGPSSSPIHRPAHSPHRHPPTSSSINPPGLMHPLPRHYYPGLHSPPLMLPRGPVPMPPLMNFGIPSFSPLLPHPTVLVPYPIVIPLPVPVPIPIPIPVPPKRNLETPNHNGVIQPVPEGIDRCRSIPARFPSPGIPEGKSQLLQPRTSGNVPHGLHSPNSKDVGWVKSERPFSSPSSMCHSGPMSPGAHYSTSPSSTQSSECLTDYKQQQHSERQVIQRVLQRAQVKPEPSVKTVVDILGIVESGSMQGNRSGLNRSSPSPVTSRPSSIDPIYQHQDGHTSPSHTPTSPTVNKHLYDPMASTLKSQKHGPNGISSVLSIASPGSTIPQKVPIPPADQALTELESIKENKCSVVCPVRVEGQVNQTEETSAVVRDAGGDDSHLPDEDHAYALPTAPKTGGTTTTTTTPLLLPKLRDKGSLRSPANTPSAGDMEPALKRRCLRIRDQNK